MKKELGLFLATTLFLSGCNQLEENGQEEQKIEVQEKEKQQKTEEKNDVVAEKEIKKEEKDTETIKEEDYAKDDQEENIASGKYYEKRYYNSKVFIYITGKDEAVQPTFGKDGILERLGELTLPEEVAKINMGTFDSKKEHNGLYINDGEVVFQNDERYDVLEQKENGEIKISNYKDEYLNEVVEENKKDETTENTEKETEEIDDEAKKDVKRIDNYSKEVKFAVAGKYALVKDGKVNLENAKTFNDYNEKTSRSLFGQREDGKYILAVVQGDSMDSQGVTAEQAAEIMIDLGAKEAINFDNGHSSALYVNKERKTTDLFGEKSIGSALIVTKEGGE